MSDVARVATTIQAMRGIAAAMVFIVHFSSFALAPSGQGPLFLLANSIAQTFGHAGVDFFFVISGIIMLHGHAPRAAVRPDRRDGGLSETRRMVRIYPLLWISLVVIVWARGKPPATRRSPPSCFASSRSSTYRKHTLWLGLWCLKSGST